MLFRHVGWDQKELAAAAAVDNQARKDVHYLVPRWLGLLGRRFWDPHSNLLLLGLCIAVEEPESSFHLDDWLRWGTVDSCFGVGMVLGKAGSLVVLLEVRLGVGRRWLFDDGVFDGNK